MSTPTRPRVTLVSAVHDDAEWLSQFIDAVADQRLGEGELQVVMVDCGSTDSSLDQLRAWESRSGGTVTVLALEGASVGAARNAGLAEAGGEWVSFPRACDGLDPDYLARLVAFAGEHPEAVVVSTNRQIVDAGGKNATNNHPLRMFHRGDRVLDLDLVPEAIVGDPTSSFFRTDELRAHDVRFGDLRSAAPDAFDLAWRLLVRSGNTHVGLMRSARYHQRRGVLITGRPESMPEPVATDGDDPTLEMLRRSYLDVLAEASDASGVPEWLEHQVVYGLAHFFNTNDSRPPVGVPVGATAREAFHALVGEVLGQVEVDDVVPYTMGRIRRLARYALQHGYAAAPWLQPFVLMDHLDDEQRLVRCSYYYTGEPPTEEFRSNGAPVTPVHAKTRTLFFTGRHLMSHRIAWVPFKGMMEARLTAAPTTSSSSTRRSRASGPRRASPAGSCGRTPPGCSTRRAGRSRRSPRPARGARHSGSPAAPVGPAASSPTPGC